MIDRFVMFLARGDVIGVGLAAVLAITFVFLGCSIVQVFHSGKT